MICSDPQIVIHFLSQNFIVCFSQDFDGTMEDVPKEEDGDKEEEDSNGEEEEDSKEMGDAGDDAEALDEQLWGDEKQNEQVTLICSQAYQSILLPTTRPWDNFSRIEGYGLIQSTNDSLFNISKRRLANHCFLINLHIRVVQYVHRFSISL